MEMIAMVTATSKAPLAVLAVVLTAAVVDGALVLVCTVSTSVHVVAELTGAGVAALGVSADVVASVVPLTLVDIFTRSLISADPVTTWTHALIAPVCVDTLTAAHPVT